MNSQQPPNKKIPIKFTKTNITKPKDEELIIRNGEHALVDGKNIKFVNEDKTRIQLLSNVPKFISKYCVGSMSEKDAMDLARGDAPDQKFNAWSAMIIKAPNNEYYTIPTDPDNIREIQRLILGKAPDQQVDPGQHSKSKIIIKLSDLEEASKKNGSYNSTSFDAKSIACNIKGKISQKTVDSLMSNASGRIWNSTDSFDIIKPSPSAPHETKNLCRMTNEDKYMSIQSGNFTFPIVDIVDLFLTNIATECAQSHEINKYKRIHLVNKDYSKFKLLENLLEMFDTTHQVEHELAEIHRIMCSLYTDAIDAYNRMSIYLNKKSVRGVYRDDAPEMTEDEPPSHHMSVDTIILLGAEGSKLVPSRGSQLMTTVLHTSFQTHKKKGSAATVSIDMNELDTISVPPITSTDGDDKSDSGDDEMIIEEEVSGEQDESEEDRFNARDFDNQYSYLWRIINMYYRVDFDFDVQDPNEQKKILALLQSSGIFHMGNISNRDDAIVSPMFDTNILDIFRLAQSKKDLELHGKQLNLDNIITHMFRINSLLEKQKNYLNQSAMDNFNWSSEHNSNFTFSELFYKSHIDEDQKDSKSKILQYKNEAQRYEIKTHDDECMKRHTTKLVDLQQRLDNVCKIVKKYILKIKDGVTREDIAIDIMTSGSLSGEFKNIDMVILANMSNNTFMVHLLDSFDFIMHSMMLAEHKCASSPSLSVNNQKRIIQPLSDDQRKKLEKSDASYAKIVEKYKKMNIMHFICHPDIHYIFAQYMAVQMRLLSLRRDINERVDRKKLTQEDRMNIELRKSEFDNLIKILMLEGFYKIQVFTCKMNENQYRDINKTMYSLKCIIDENPLVSVQSAQAKSHQILDNPLDEPCMKSVNLVFSYSAFIMRTGLKK